MQSQPTPTPSNLYRIGVAVLDFSTGSLRRCSLCIRCAVCTPMPSCTSTLSSHTQASGGRCTYPSPRSLTPDRHLSVLPCAFPSYPGSQALSLSQPPEAHIWPCPPHPVSSPPRHLPTSESLRKRVDRREKAALGQY